jgi:hypothetical protein
VGVQFATIAINVLVLDRRYRLERLPRSLILQLPGREPSKFGIPKRRWLLGGRRIAVVDLR